MILNSLRIPYTAIDIAAPGHEDETDFMRANAKKKDGQRHVLPPQIFNGEKYCGVWVNPFTFILLWKINLESIRDTFNDFNKKYH